MPLFKKKSTPTGDQLEKLYQEVNLQVQMNRELKESNESLKRDLMSHKKELARFEQELRSKPLSQLQILSQELTIMHQEADSIVQNDKELACKLLEITRTICIDAFELLNTLKEKTE